MAITSSPARSRSARDCRGKESADLTRAVLEAFAGQLSNGEARRLGEDGYRHLVGQLPAAYVELAGSSS